MLDNILYGPSWQEGGLADDIRHISARTFHPNRVDKVAKINILIYSKNKNDLTSHSGPGPSLNSAPLSGRLQIIHRKQFV